MNTPRTVEELLKIKVNPDRGTPPEDCSGNPMDLLDRLGMRMECLSALMKAGAPDCACKRELEMINQSRQAIKLNEKAVMQFIRRIPIGLELKDDVWIREHVLHVALALHRTNNQFR